MASCDNLIKMNIERNCDDPLAMGYEKKGILINRDDIDFGAVVFDDENNNIIKELPLKAGKFGYWVYQHGTKPFNGTNKSVEVGELGNSVTSNVHIILPDHSPALIDGVIDPLLNGEFVFISFNKHKGLVNAKGASAFEVFGFFQGLSISEGSRDAYAEDTGGGWAITLTESKAPKAGLFLFDTDYATTESMVNSLVQAE